MPITVPTLGPDHYASTPQKKFEYMMAHFFESEYSQSNIFKRMISSLPWVAQETNGDTLAFCTLLQRTLETYLRTAFNNVAVEVTEVPTNGSMLAQVRLYVSCQDADGTQLNLGKMIRAESGLIKEIVDIVNG